MKWKHLVIFRQPGIYAGWPANYGIWRSADNSIRTGFFAAKFLERETKQRFHPFDYNDREGRHIQIVSKDDGINWAVEQGPVLMPSVAFCQSGGKIWPDRVIGSQSSDSSPELNAQKLDLSHRDVRMLFSRTSFGHQPRSWWVFTTDGGRTWSPPKRIPINLKYVTRGIAARTDYCVLKDGTALMGLSVSRQDGGEGETLLVRTDGVKWTELGIIGEPIQPQSRADINYNIMSSVVNFDRKHENKETWDALMAIRHRNGPKNEIHVYRLNTANGSNKRASDYQTGWGGNPPAMVRTKAGRNFLFYWVRSRRLEVESREENHKARLMCQELNDDGTLKSSHQLREAPEGRYDLGYCRAIERLDGSIVVIYYFDDGTNCRSIESTIVKVDDE